MNKKAQAFRNKNHLGQQTESNTQNLEQLGQIMMPLAMKVFEIEKTVASLNRQLNESKATAKAAEYRARALQNLSTHSESTVRAEIVTLQKKDFQIQSDLDDQYRGLTVTEGTATEGQFAIVTGKVFKDGVELENEEVIGSKLELGKDELFKGIDEAIFGMAVNEIKMATFKVQEQEYQFHFQLLGLRNKPVQETTEGNQSEEAQTNQ